MDAYQRSLNSFANFHLISLRLLLSEDFDDDEEEEEEDSKQQAKNENRNIATPAVKPRRVAGNDAITVEPLLKHNNGPSLKTPAVVGSIVRNDDGKCFIQ